MQTHQRLKDILVRYLLMILLGLGGLWIIYFIFSPLTIYPIHFILNLFYDATLYKNIILIAHQFPIELVDACIAGSAYYLLFILNFSTPDIKLKKRLKILFTSFLALLIINILRIVLLSFLLVNGSAFFDFTHKAFWYLGNVIFIVGIWFTEVKVFQIKEIPFYSDIKFFLKLKKESHK